MSLFSTSEVVNPGEFNNVCRICFSTKSLSSFFEVAYKDVLLDKIFYECTSITIKEDDKFPNKICDNCIDKLCNTYKFLKSCHNSDEMLKKRIKNCKAEVEYDGEIIGSSKESKVDKRTYGKNTGVKEEVYNNDEIISTEGKNSSKLSVYVCKECNKKFPNLYDFIGHYHGKKHEVNINKCPVCNISFNGLMVFRKHLLLHSKLFRCNFCNTTFDSLQHLKKHVFQYGSDFLCEICNIEIKSAWSVQQHVSLHDNQSWCICKKCGKSFSSLRRYLLHIKTHMIFKYNTTRLVKRYKCVFCLRKYGSYDALYSHLKSHTTKPRMHKAYKRSENPSYNFACNVCDKKFVTKHAVTTHARQHTGERPFQCFCGSSFASKSYLMLHARIHSGEKPYVCEYCTRRFVQKQQLVAHIRTHTKEKPFECPFCGKAFATRGNVTVHARVHTGERPYVCETCSKGFKDSNGLKRHKCHREQAVKVLQVKHE